MDMDRSEQWLRISKELKQREPCYINSMTDFIASSKLFKCISELEKQIIMELYKIIKYVRNFNSYIK